MLLLVGLWNVKVRSELNRHGVFVGVSLSNNRGGGLHATLTCSALVTAL